MNRDEFEHVDITFRENYEEILEGVRNLLIEHGLGDYQVTDLTFAPPNPPICIPYCRYVPGKGIECGVSCFNED